MVIVYVCAAALAADAGPMGTARMQLAMPVPAAGTTSDDRATTAAHRDPFVRPTVEEIDTTPPPAAAPPADGLAGLSIEEIVVRGVLHASGRSVGFVQAPDQKHYVVRAGDRLRDGVVEAVSADALVILAGHGGAGTEGARPGIRKSLRVRPEGR